MRNLRLLFFFLKERQIYARGLLYFPKLVTLLSPGKHLLQPGLSAAPTAVVDKATRPAYNGTELARTSML
jgi:hypothetical protein